MQVLILYLYLFSYLKTWPVVVVLLAPDLPPLKSKFHQLLFCQSFNHDPLAQAVRVRPGMGNVRELGQNLWLLIDCHLLLTDCAGQCD